MSSSYFKYQGTARETRNQLTQLFCCAAGQVVSTGPQDPTLDKFFAQHNSEDNASFQELLKASQQRLRKAKPWLFKNHNPARDTQLLLASVPTDIQAQQLPAAIAAPPPGEDASQQVTSSQAEQAPAAHQPSTSSSDDMRLRANDTSIVTRPAGGGEEQPSTSAGQIVLNHADASVATRDADRVVQRPAVPTDGFGTTGQESQTLLSWPHTNKSALYYDSSQRDVVPYTEAELADMVQGPPKEIKHSATRFPSDFDASQQTSKVRHLHGCSSCCNARPCTLHVASASSYTLLRDITIGWSSLKCAYYIALRLVPRDLRVLLVFAHNWQRYLLLVAPTAVLACLCVGMWQLLYACALGTGGCAWSHPPGCYPIGIFCTVVQAERSCRVHMPLT